VVDFLTLGNHAFDAKGGREYLGREQRVARPANLEVDSPGRGWGTVEAGGVRGGIANVQDRVFMRDTPRSPFEPADEAVTEMEASGVDLVVVDVHAEATSEKQAIGYYLTGRIQVVV
jgi:2',3'-cyclic-nucleotide 2'-phosphodiesterase